MRQLRFTGLTIIAPTTPCAHSCRYCSIGTTSFSEIPFDRLAEFVDRFVDWRRVRNMQPFKLWFFAGNSFDHEIDVMTKLAALWRRTGQPVDGIATGGLRLRDDVELRQWLAGLLGLGINRLHVAVAGYGEAHDRWNGRRGDFDYLMTMQKIGAELGMKASQSLFLTKDTIPFLDDVIAGLDDTGIRVAWRHIFPFGYLGRAALREDVRIDEADLGNLPPHITAWCGQLGEWHSERQWIDIIRSRAEEPREVYLRLDVDAANLERIENLPCDMIVKDLKARTTAAYRAIPSIHALCDAVGDPSGTKIYTSRRDVERMWLRRFMQDNPMDFEDALTDLAINI